MEAIKKFKKQLSALADAVREKTGITEKMSIDELVEEITWLDAVGDDTKTYILMDEAGNEIPAVIVDEPVTLTATANDIRIGTTAVTETGIVEGEKIIPGYQTTEGYVIVTPGSAYEIPRITNCEYTKLQAVVCVFNTSLSNSVAVEKVCIDGKVYNANDTEVLSEVNVDVDGKIINLGIANDSGSVRVLRFFTYKEC